MTAKLDLTAKTFQAVAVRAVDHPDHGELLSAIDVLHALGYSTSGSASVFLNHVGIPKEERIVLAGSTLMKCSSTPVVVPQGRALFLTRKGVHLLLMSSHQPQAKEFRHWLAGEVIPAIVTTGGYLLNESARATARADDRTSVPFPEDLSNAYATLIAEKKALEAWQKAAEKPINTAQQ